MFGVVSEAFKSKSYQTFEQKARRYVSAQAMVEGLGKAEADVLKGLSDPLILDARDPDEVRSFARTAWS